MIGIFILMGDFEGLYDKANTVVKVKMGDGCIGGIIHFG